MRAGEGTHATQVGHLAGTVAAVRVRAGGGAGAAAVAHRRCRPGLAFDRDQGACARPRRLHVGCYRRWAGAPRRRRHAAVAAPAGRPAGPARQQRAGAAGRCARPRVGGDRRRRHQRAGCATAGLRALPQGHPSATGQRRYLGVRAARRQRLVRCLRRRPAPDRRRRHEPSLRGGKRRPALRYRACAGGGCGRRAVDRYRCRPGAHAGRPHRGRAPAGDRCAAAGVLAHHAGRWPVGRHLGRRLAARCGGRLDAAGVVADVPPPERDERDRPRARWRQLDRQPARAVAAAGRGTAEPGAVGRPRHPARHHRDAAGCRWRVVGAGGGRGPGLPAPGLAAIGAVRGRNRWPAGGDVPRTRPRARRRVLAGRVQRHGRAAGDGWRHRPARRRQPGAPAQHQAAGDRRRHRRAPVAGASQWPAPGRQ